jgi:hypothetical protein
MADPRSASDPDYWVRWHQAYEDPDSALSLRLRLVQDGVRAALEGMAAGRGPGCGPGRGPGSISVVSMCAGQGRDVIDVVAGHRLRGEVRARLVERDRTLVAFARQRAAAAGLGDQVEVVEGDASMLRSYDGYLPADLVLICGVFGNIGDGDGDGDVRATVSMLPALCAPGATVVWTRHQRPPDLTPPVRRWFAEAGFVERSFVAPSGYVLSVGCHEWCGGADGGGASPLDPDLRLFDFSGDGTLPA